ncbi:Protein TolB [wastewater metagenome]|uniref:Protein TolB n=2 Tax=unclassified sequences TaxID=12908 RepID=A0A5B8RBW8_9ZZZZ|nr:MULTISPECIES: Tol-Pal system beta propeller repeat protein TolB [Arhodomonas]MCS4504168.1 Tol-Pal system beta propeller repeat protein TolB [Arhodomonas aquaeolei]QEA04882.1 protein TolB [uncultured organism]
MKRLQRLLLAVILGLAATQAQAQITVDITGGALGALPIAVVPFEGGDTAPEDIAGIVREDLTRTGLFEAVPREDFLAQPSRMEDVNFRNWRVIGADNLLVGSVERSGGQFQVRFELLDVYAGSRMVGKRYTATGSDLRRLAHTIANEVFRSLIGRDGGFNSRLAYVRASGAGDARQFRLVVAQADGHHPQTIVTSREPLLSPAWGPKGERIAYVSFEAGRSEIVVQNVATGQRRTVAQFKGINGAPAWSPDGSRLAVTLSRGDNPDIYILDVDSGETRQFTSHWAIDTEPVWAPDGKSVLFTSDRAGGPQIFRKGIRGGDAERLTWDGDYNASADISPDGRLLTMVHRRNGQFRIAVKNLETDTTRVLSQGPLDESPTFAPNGVMIAYTRTHGGTPTIATISVHGRAEANLIQGNGDVREPAWSPE